MDERPTEAGGDRLGNQFLIAMPALDDPNFAQTVTLLCEHTPDGAMGIIINRPTEVKLAELFDHLGLDVSAGVAAADQPIYAGGPVQRDRGFVLHPRDQAWDATQPLSDQLAITTSRDILAAIARGEGPRDYLVALGYAGWGAGQLEEELTQNTWLSVPADPAVIFATAAAKRWRAAAAALGVDISLLSSESGHA